MRDYSIKKSEISKLFPNWNQDLVDDAFIGVTDSIKVDRFIDFMNNAFIPSIIKKYKDNAFV